MAARPLRASSAPPARTAAPRQAAKTAAQPGPRPVPVPARTATLVSAPPAVRLAGHRISTETRGEPIPPTIRRDIERTVGTSLADVRVHTGAQAQNVAVSLSARAVTHGSHIFLGPGERADDLALIAHEAAHVVQQHGAPTPQRFTEGGADPYEREAQTVSAAAVRGDAVTVRERTTPRVQRLGISDALDKLASLANNIPGFRMFTIVLGVNPINMSAVSRSAANIMRAIVEFIPGGGLITQALDSYGVFDKVGNWVDGQLRSLGLSGATIRQSVMDFVNGLKLSDLWDLGGVIERGLNLVRTPIRRIIDFAISLAGQILTFIKDAILIPLARLAEGTRGYDLLKAVLGTDPVTGQPVPRTAETLIPGFLKLIGEEETWENMQKSRALPRAWAWFQSAMGTLLGFVQQVPQLIISTLQSLTIEDVVLLPRAFMKVGTAFAGFLGNFISWAGTALWNLLEIIFDVVSPGALGYIKKTGAALKSIFKNPLPFVGNLVKAAMSGFQAFAGNFLEHLKAGLINWLTGSLPGVYIPKAFTLPELVKFVLSVLGLTWGNIRPKLVKAVGETAVKAMETGFKLVVTLVTEGPAAFWEQLKGELATLKDQVIGGITDMVVDMVVKKAIPKLIAMFIPGAGFISAILSIYDTVMVFVQKIKTIIQVVTGFIDSIVAIAAGNISAAAKKVESILAGLLSLAISFLAGFAGLGKVADKVMGVIMKIRAPIDKALDTLIAWVVKMAKTLFAKVFGKNKDDKRTDAQKKADLDKAMAEAETLQKKADITEEEERKGLATIKAKYKMVRLDLVVDNVDDAALTETVHAEGEINPPGKTKKSKITSKNGVITEMTISRPSFSSPTKKAVNPNDYDLVAKELDRCHVVSSSDMATHYESTLKGKKWTEAKKLLETKPQVKVTVAALTDKAILAAARLLHKTFFNDVDNLFLGGASVNRSLGERLDPRHPDMKNAKKLEEHIRDMRKKYGIGPVKITR